MYFKFNIRYLTQLLANIAKKIPSKLEVAPPLSKMCEWVMEWVIPLRLLRLLEHLAVLINLLNLMKHVIS